MKKRIFKLLAFVGIMMLCCVGCSQTPKNSGEEIVLKNGVLSWEEDSSAEYYEVLMGDISTTCEEPEMSMAELCEQEGGYTVQVFSVLKSGKQKEIGSLNIMAEALPKAAVSVVKDDAGQASFVWQADVRAGGYVYNFNNGSGNFKASPDDEGYCRVEVPNNGYAMFTVTMLENSEDNTYYIGNNISCRYLGDVVYDITGLVKTPFFTVCDGTSPLELTLGTTLSTGVYDLEIDFRLVNTDGQSLTGNGSWGRRVAPVLDWGKLFWFCETDPNNSSGTYAAANTLKPADETTTYTIPGLGVSEHGEAKLTVFDFKANEVLVVEDIRYQGRSVMAKGLHVQSDKEREVFDVAKLGNYLAVYESAAVNFNANTREKCALQVPMNVKDGVYKVEVNYQIMTSNGKMVRGNGIHGGNRAVSCVDAEDRRYYCEFPPSASVQTKLPYATQMITQTFTVKVKNKAFNLYAQDFDGGEILAVKSIKQIGDGVPRGDIKQLLSGSKYVYTGDGEWGGGSLQVITTKTGKREQIEVELTYVTADVEGYPLIGNGLWGRRFEDDTSELHFICDTAPHEDYPDAVGSNKATNLVTKKVLVTVNKTGKFYLIMSDFNTGDLFIVKDVKYQGESILAK